MTDARSELRETVARCIEQSWAFGGWDMDDLSGPLAGAAADVLAEAGLLRPEGMTAEKLFEIADDYEIVLRHVGGLPRDRVLSPPVMRRLGLLRGWARELSGKPQAAGDET